MATSDTSDIYAFLETYDIRTLASDIPNDVLCSICGKVMVDAHYGPCSCQYCRKCIMKHLIKSGDKKCPGNGDDCDTFVLDANGNVEADNRANRKIERLRVRCPTKGCFQEDTVANIAGHVLNCKTALEKCPYFGVGCTFVSPSADGMDSHLLRNSVEHAGILMEFVVNVKNEINEDQRRDNVVERLQMLEDAMGKQKVEIQQINDSLTQTVLFQDRRISEMNNIIASMKRQMTGRGCKSNETVEARDLDERRNQEWQTEKNELLTSLHEMKKEMNEVKDQLRMLRHPDFVWKIDQLGKLRKNARNGGSNDINSEPFYSHQNGYKLCLNIKPNGYDKGDDTKIFIGFTILKGEYDDILQWPFRFRIVISVLEHANGIEAITKKYHIDQEIKTNEHHFFKPNGDNRCLGDVDFLAWHKLKHSRRVYKNDCIFVKCRIE